MRGDANNVYSRYLRKTGFRKVINTFRDAAFLPEFFGRFGASATHDKI